MIFRLLVTLKRAITLHKKVRRNTSRKSALATISMALFDKNLHLTGKEIDRGK
jgi:hypothetical protein